MLPLAQVAQEPIFFDLTADGTQPQMVTAWLVADWTFSGATTWTSPRSRIAR